ncbi:MAG: hypothetical protein SH809_07910 [Rhodothermales bacterium]|nr:hypothetical protein [Rhodothermales bacterium]
MPRIFHSLGALLPALIVMGILALPALAQTHTLTIQNGEVRVDGRLQEPDQIPPSLQVNDVTVQLSFTGATAFTLDGHSYTIVEGALRELPAKDQESRQTTVVFRNAAPGAPPASAEAMSYDDAASPLMQHYFLEVQREDNALYNRLVTEFDLEAETLTRAQRIRGMAAGTDRDAQITELRQLLVRIFELKQENRRMEVEQLEKQLNELQRRFEEREDLKSQIIDQRLRELIQ